jgi:hypothetical protein
MTTATLPVEETDPVRARRQPLRTHRGTSQLGAGGFLLRPETPEARRPEEPEEVLVADVRAGLTPNDIVERKLLHLLRGAAVAGSHMRMWGRGRSGSEGAAAQTCPKE